MAQKDDAYHVVQCFLYGQGFAYGPHRYDGKWVGPWKVSVCQRCLSSNWDGIVPRPELMSKFEAKGIQPEFNEKGWIKWPATFSN
jgi:hypothetical protein